MGFKTLSAVFAAGALMYSAAFVSAPATAEVSFKGKTVTIVVPFQEGGGSDVLTRLFQPFLNKHLPGNPKVVVFNRPGGAATKGSNYFDRKAKPEATAGGQIPNFIIEPDPRTILDTLFPLQAKLHLFRVYLEAGLVECRRSARSRAPHRRWLPGPRGRNPKCSRDRAAGRCRR